MGLTSSVLLFENRSVSSLVDGSVQWRGGRGGTCPPSDNFLGVLKSKGGTKIRNCQCKTLYKIR